MRKHLPKLIAIVFSIFVVILANKIFFPDNFDYYKISVDGLAGLVGLGIIFELIVDGILLIIFIPFFTVQIEKNFFKTTK